MSPKKEYSLAEIAEFIGSKVVGNSSAVVNNISTLENATKESISFLSNKKYYKYIKTTSASAVIVSNSCGFYLNWNFFNFSATHSSLL